LPNLPKGYTVFSIPVGVVYRPNEAKVKNLRAKDYLGKAKLVAAVDKNNAFTGFTGAEIKRMNSVSAAKDDRSEADISYAASNLVKTDLKSRYRQQSEPPPNRDVFPPTPPPDNDRVSGASSSNSATIVGSSRSESVRNGPKLRPLDLSTAGFAGTNDRPELSRTMSERSSGEKSTGGRGRAQSERSRNSPITGGGQRMDRRPSQGSNGGYGQQEYDEVYDMYGRQAAPAPTNRPRAATGTKSTPRYISEEEDEAVNSFDEPDFEMISARSSGRKRRSVPEAKKIRVKVHADDTRYVMVGVAIEFKDFVDQIRIKFGIRQNFKVKIKDEGDMITMADQDDLDMAIAQSKSDARKERNEMGKMEVSFHDKVAQHEFKLISAGLDSTSIKATAYHRSTL
jgi:hypothetical protein